MKVGRVENVVFLENDAVVNAVQPPGRGDEIAPGAAAFAKLGNEVLRFNQLVFQKADENEPVQGALRDFGQRFAVELGIVVFENVGQRVAVRVQFFQKRIVNGLPAARGRPALRRAALFGQGFGVFFQRAARHGFARKQPVNFREFFLVGVLAVMEFFEIALERGFQVRLEPAIHNLELLKIKQRGNGRLAVPSVADRLEIIVGRGDVPKRLFGFDVEFYVPEDSARDKRHNPRGAGKPPVPCARP